MSDDFCYLLRVRYSECDAQRVVFNGRYVDYIDVAFNEYMRVIWGDYNDILSKGLDMQVVNVSINWKAPAHFDEVLAIKIRLNKIGNSSFSFLVDFYNQATSQLLAHGEIVYVMVSPIEHTKMEIPKDVRDQLEKGAKGIVVDHAGSNVNG